MDPSRSRFLRQLDILPPEQLTFPITVIGAGAIGSAAVITLAKMGCRRIAVWDDDILAEHNVSNQMCKPSAVGQPKVDALAELVWGLAEVRIHTRNERYRGQRLEGVVIVAVDSMTSRMEVWKRVKFDTVVPLLIDARMGAEFGRLYAIRPSDPDDVDFYESNLYPSSEAEPLPCSARAIIYCPTLVAALIALLVKRSAAGEQPPSEVLLDLPGLHVAFTASPRPVPAEG